MKNIDFSSLPNPDIEANKRENKRRYEQEVAEYESIHPDYPIRELGLLLQYYRAYSYSGYAFFQTQLFMDKLYDVVHQLVKVEDYSKGTVEIVRIQDVLTVIVKCDFNDRRKRVEISIRPQATTDNVHMIVTEKGAEVFSGLIAAKNISEKF